MSPRKLFVIVVALAVLVGPAPAHAAGGSTPPPVRVSPPPVVRTPTPTPAPSRPSSGIPQSKPGTPGARSGSPSSSSSSSKSATAKPTIARPSTGAKQQPAPAPKLVPPTPPAATRVPAGRNYVRDRTVIVTQPRYLDPYSPAYYGSPGSPYFYLYLASLNSGAHPQPWQAGPRPHSRGVATWVLVISVIAALALGFVAGMFTRDW